MVQAHRAGMAELKMDRLNTQMLKEIVEGIDRELFAFYESAKGIWPDKEWTSPEEVAARVLEEDLLPISYNTRPFCESLDVRRRHRRISWQKRAEENLSSFPPSSTSSFFNYLISDAIRDRKGFAARYGTFDASVAAASVIKEIENWRKEKGLFVAFPIFPFPGIKTDPRELYEEDCASETCRMVAKLYGFNLETFFVKQPKDFLTAPVFSSQRGKVRISEIGNLAYAAIFSAGGYEIRFSDIPEKISSESDSIEVFDAIDMEAISFLLTNSGIDLSQPSSITEIQQTTVGDVAKAVYRTENPSQQQRNNIRRRLERYIAPIEVRDQSSGFFQAWTLLSVLEISEPDAMGRRIVSYSFGKVLSDAVTQNALVTVPSSKYFMLGSDHAKMLYYRLQQDRISRCSNGFREITYTYDYLVKSLLLRYKSLSRRRTVIREAISEVKETTGIVESFETKDSGVRVVFSPLTPEERRDFMSSHEEIEGPTDPEDN